MNVISSNGSLFNEPWEITNKTGDYFKVFSPFWKHCLQKITVPELTSIHHCPQSIDVPSDELSDWELLPQKVNWAAVFAQYWQPGEEGAQQKRDTFIEQHLCTYKEARDFPAADATSRLSPIYILVKSALGKLKERWN